MKRLFSKNQLTVAVELVLLILLDQFTKYLAVHLLKGTKGISLIPGIFEFYYLENLGAAWGILKNARYFFLITALILIGFIIYYYRRLPDDRHWNFCRVLMILLTAGAVGNSIDRLIHGYVVDFLYVSVINFPVFNVADCYVTVSIILFLFYYRREVYEWIRKES